MRPSLCSARTRARRGPVKPRARRGPVKLLALLWIVTASPACDGGQAQTRQPGEGEGGELGDAKLDGRGPGGIGGVTAGLTKAAPEIVEAEALLAEGKAEQALATIDAAIARDPTHARFHYVRGNALSYLDRDGEARVAYIKANELDDTDALPHAALGNLIAFAPDATLEQRRESIVHFQTALHLDPRLATAHQSLGVVLLSLGQAQEAVEALDTANRLMPTAEAAYSLAQAHAELGDDAKALSFAKSAVEYEPGPSGVDLRLFHARLLAKAGRVDDATREFEQAATLAADSAPLRLEVARGLLELGQADAAMVHMQWLLEAGPDQAPILVNYGRILVAQGQAKAGLAQFDRALELSPGSQAAQTYRIEALVAAKRCKDARAQFDALAEQLGWSRASGAELPRALAKAKAYLDAGSCK
jgi:tetratricopeptide (TPR) repeat protein